LPHRSAIIEPLSDTNICRMCDFRHARRGIAQENQRLLDLQANINECSGCGRRTLRAGCGTIRIRALRIEQHHRRRYLCAGGSVTPGQPMHVSRFIAELT
jgi:hypothetical protein